MVIAALPASGLRELDMPQEEHLRLAPTHFREQDGGSRSRKSWIGTISWMRGILNWDNILNEGILFWSWIGTISWMRGILNEGNPELGQYPQWRDPVLIQRPGLSQTCSMMRAIIIVRVGLESGGPGQQHEALPEFASQQDLITGTQIVKKNADSNQTLSCQHFSKTLDTNAT